MGGPGAGREQEGEIEFSSEELVEMKVEVAGREDAGGASRRKKRSLRVPADEVPRGGAPPTLVTEPDLEAIVAAPPEEGDELIEHAFSNGGHAEGEVKAASRFNAAEEVITDSRRPVRADSDDDDLEPDIQVETPARKEIVNALRRLPPNVQALVRAVAVPVAPPVARLDSNEVEQLDSDELEVMEPPKDDALLADATVPVERIDPEPAPEPAPAEASPDERIRAVTMPVMSPPVEASAADADASADADAEELSADDAEEDVSGDMTLDVTVEEPPQRTRTAPPATPAAAAMPPPRARSTTPVIVPVPGSIAPATAPLAPPPPPGAEAEGALRPRRRRRAKQWFEEIFDDDYLRTLPYLSAKQTEREVSFILESLDLPQGAALLDLACGYGRHAMELAGRGHQVTGLDLSLPLLIRAADAARRLGVAVNFVHGDMREMTFDAEFDAAYCMFTSFGYFDDDTNRKVAANLQRALKPGGKVLIELVNRDYITRDLPTRVWWQGEGCVVLEEVDFNYFSSRLQVQRSIIFEDGRQLEQEISIRAYSLHEIGKVLHHAGFRVIEVSGGLGLRGKFFGAHSRQLLVLAEKKAQP